jgi:hypothetical protein
VVINEQCKQNTNPFFVRQRPSRTVFHSSGNTLALGTGRQVAKAYQDERIDPLEAGGHRSVGSKAGGNSMSYKIKTLQVSANSLQGTSKVFQPMTTSHSRHSVNNNTASNAGTDPALLELGGVK